MDLDIPDEARAYVESLLTEKDYQKAKIAESARGPLLDFIFKRLQVLVKGKTTFSAVFLAEGDLDDKKARRAWLLKWWLRRSSEIKSVPTDKAKST